MVQLNIYMEFGEWFWKNEVSLGKVFYRILPALTMRKVASVKFWKVISVGNSQTFVFNNKWSRLKELINSYSFSETPRIPTF